MIKYTFEFLECSLPRPAVTPIYGFIDPAKDTRYEVIERVGLQRESASPNGGTVTVRITAHVGDEITASHEVQIYTKKEVIEGIMQIMTCATDAVKNYYRVEGWPNPWENVREE